MKTNLLLLVLAALPARAAAGKAVPMPQAAEALRLALEPAATAYVGRVRANGRLMRVRFEPPGRYRRELLDGEGRLSVLVVSDGKTEWVYDKAARQARRGRPSGLDHKKLALGEDRDLLKANYELSVSTAGRVARRAVWLVTLRSRFGGAALRRLWLDQKTGLILKSQAYADGGAVSSQMEFETAVFPKKPQNPRFFEFTPPKGAKVLEPPKAAVERAAAPRAVPRGPAWLPSGYVFKGQDVLERGGRKIVHQRYSDGVNVLSLFQCPRRLKLDFGATRARPVRLASGEGTLARTRAGNVLGWTSAGLRFVLVGAVSSETLERVASSIR